MSIRPQPCARRPTRLHGGSDAFGGVATSIVRSQSDPNHRMAPDLLIVTFGPAVIALRPIDSHTSGLVGSSAVVWGSGGSFKARSRAAAIYSS